MNKTRLALTIAFIVAFQLLAIIIWCQAFFTWPEVEDFPPRLENTLIRLITIIIWIWIAIVLGVLVKRWYYVLALMTIPLFKTFFSTYGFDIMRTYSISQIAADEERLNHVMSTSSGLVVLSILIVMLLLRLFILDPMELSRR